MMRIAGAWIAAAALAAAAAAEHSAGDDDDGECSVMQLGARRRATAGSAVNLDFDRGGLAVQGYDVVSYWKRRKPVLGKESINSTYQGGVYRFATEAHKKLFESQGGAKFAPANGGFCAFGIVSKNVLMSVDPLSYLIEKGKLLLFHRARWENGRKMWKLHSRFKNLEKTRAERYEGKTYFVFNVDWSYGSPLANGGYDPVSYFRSSTPQKGSEDITSQVTWTNSGGASITYRFVSEANKKLFDAQGGHEKYAPRYGGFCAKAVAENHLVAVDYLNYKIEDGRLLLFYQYDGASALPFYNAHLPQYAQLAPRFWRQKAFSLAYQNCRSRPFPYIVVDSTTIGSCKPLKTL